METPLSSVGIILSANSNRMGSERRWLVEAAQLDNHGRAVIETTTSKEKSFGFMLTPLEAQQFDAFLR